MFARIENNLVVEYPLEWSTIVERHPHMLFAANSRTPPDGYVRVVVTQKPAFDPVTQKVVETAPVSVNSSWFTTWEVRELPQPLQTSNKADALVLLKRQFDAGIKARLNIFAAQREYESIDIACSYAADLAPDADDTEREFYHEGLQAVIARSKTWAAYINHMRKVDAGDAPMPKSYDDLAVFLPVLEWNSL